MENDQPYDRVCRITERLAALTGLISGSIKSDNEITLDCWAIDGIHSMLKGCIEDLWEVLPTLKH